MKKKSLIYTNPDLEGEYDDVIPFSELTRGSEKKVWWKCKFNHRWQAKIYSRAKGKGCPHCSGRIPNENKYLREANPLLEKSWSPKNTIMFNEVLASDKRKVVWVCENNHEFESAISSRAKGSGCRYCLGMLPTPVNNLKYLYPEISKSFDTNKNNISPGEVLPKSGKKYWWRCDIGHEWEATPNHRVNGTGCPFCVNKKIDKKNSLQYMYPNLMPEWDFNKNTLDPGKIAPGNSEKVWWTCSKNHSYVTKIYHRTAGSGCPYCSGRLVSKENSQENLPQNLIMEWDLTKNYPQKPIGITLGSDKKVWWKCSFEHSWEATALSRLRGRDCPECIIHGKSKKELAILSEFEVLLNKQCSTPGINVGNKRNKIKVDILIDKVVIEYDGSYWHKNKEKFDLQKNKDLENAGYTIFRIRELPLSNLGRYSILVEPEADNLHVVKQSLQFMVDNNLIQIDKYIYEKYINADNLIGYDLYKTKLLKGIKKR